MEKMVTRIQTIKSHPEQNIIWILIVTEFLTIKTNAKRSVRQKTVIMMRMGAQTRLLSWIAKEIAIVYSLKPRNLRQQVVSLLPAQLSTITSLSYPYREANSQSMST